MSSGSPPFAVDCSPGEGLRRRIDRYEEFLLRAEKIFCTKGTRGERPRSMRPRLLCISVVDLSNGV